MGCGASSSTRTRSASTSANHYCKTCGTRQVDRKVTGCDVCGAFNRLQTPTTPPIHDFERTGSFSLSELQRNVVAEEGSENKATETACIAVNRQQSGGNGGQNGMQNEVGTLVSSTIENAIKRMNAVDEMGGYPGHEDQGTANCTEVQ